MQSFSFNNRDLMYKIKSKRIRMKLLSAKLIVSCLLMIIPTSLFSSEKAMYFCTAADTQFYPQLLQWIGAIHLHDFDSVAEIAIYDLGLTKKEKEHLSKISKVTINSVEMTHPDLLTLFHVRASNLKDKERTARGWYAWKPVVLKQALDKFPYVLYLDCGVVPRGTMAPIFRCMHKQGYFLMSCGHSIAWMTTDYVARELDLRAPENNFILQETMHGISAGLQGVTRRVYDSYIMPMYELTKTIAYFEDDGTTPHGFGTGRHDQTLFSIFAQKLRLKIFRKKDLLEERTAESYFHFKKQLATEQYIRYRK